MHMLQNAVHPLQELWQVKNQADKLLAYHGKTMKYDSIATSCCLLHQATMPSLHQRTGLIALLPRHQGEMSMHITWVLGDYGDNDANDIYNLDSDVIDL